MAKVCTSTSLRAAISLSVSILLLNIAVGLAQEYQERVVPPPPPHRPPVVEPVEQQAAHRPPPPPPQHQPSHEADHAPPPPPPQHQPSHEADHAPPPPQYVQQQQQDAQHAPPQYVQQQQQQQQDAQHAPPQYLQQQQQQRQQQDAQHAPPQYVQQQQQQRQQQDAQHAPPQHHAEKPMSHQDAQHQVPPQQQPQRHPVPQHPPQQAQQVDPLPPQHDQTDDHPIGPVNDLDLPDTEYQEAHREDHLFGEQSADDFADSEEHIFDEWEEHMDDFVPDMLVNFDLAPRSDEYFYQDVVDTPLLVRGGFFVSGEGIVDFSIIDPGGEIVMKKSQAESLFYFEATKVGTYNLIVSNHKWMAHKQVTFAIGCGNETVALLSHTVDDTVSHVYQIDRMIRDIQAESQYLWTRQRGHMKTVQSTLSRVLWLAALELLCLIAIWSSQVYYIKNLVSDRRLF